jgi:hypothetical protein
MIQLLRKLRTLYLSCTNETHLDTVGSEPLLRVARQIRSLLPVREGLDTGANQAKAVLGIKYEHDLTAVLAYLHSLSELSKPLFGFPLTSHPWTKIFQQSSRLTSKVM